jgi:tetratricopeptide (TPR) repeat protein
MQSENFDLSPVVARIAQYGDKNLAIEVLDAFAENATEFAQYETLAKSYSQLGYYSEAMKYGEKALTVCKNPEIEDALSFNLIPVYRNAAYPEKALEIIEYFENKNPDPALKIERAGCLYELNKRKESFEILDSIDQKKLPDFLKFKLESQNGNKNLWSGNFKKGLAQTIVAGSTVRDMESPVKGIFHSRKELDLPFWEGTPDCKNLIIYAEAGVGDEILNIRFIKHLKDRGINAVWYGVWHDAAAINKRLGVLNFFRNSGFPVITKLSEINNLQDYMWTYSQYLPINLGLEEKDLWHGSYLKAGTKDIPKDKKNIGIRWYGNPIPMHRNYH